jgi:hypothetical protein
MDVRRLHRIGPHERPEEIDPLDCSKLGAIDRCPVFWWSESNKYGRVRMESDLHNDYRDKQVPSLFLVRVRDSHWFR